MRQRGYNWAAALFSETTDIEDDGTFTFEQRTDNHLAALTGLARIQAENIEALTQSITVQGKELRAEIAAQGENIKALTESITMQGEELRAGDRREPGGYRDPPGEYGD